MVSIAYVRRGTDGVKAGLTSMNLKKTGKVLEKRRAGIQPFIFRAKRTRIKIKI